MNTLLIIQTNENSSVWLNPKHVSSIEFKENLPTALVQLLNGSTYVITEKEAKQLIENLLSC